MLEWVGLSTTRGLLESLGNIPPAEDEATHCAMAQNPAVAAELKPKSLGHYRWDRAGMCPGFSNAQ